MERILVKDKKYAGQYVAIRDFDDPQVVGYGKNPEEAIKRASQKGYKNPVIVFVPEKATVQIYDALA